MIEGFGHWKMQETARRRREVLDEIGDTAKGLNRLDRYRDDREIRRADNKDARKLGMDNWDQDQRDKKGIKLVKKTYKKRTGKAQEY